MLLPDAVRAYLRSPDERVSGLTSEQRRDELMNVRAELASEGQRELDAILGAGDAKKISGEALKRVLGLSARR